VAPVDDQSVKQVKAESQHLTAETLDECFDVFTQQERVCLVFTLITLTAFSAVFLLYWLASSFLIKWVAYYS